MRTGIQRIGKKVVNLGATVLTGWQTDTVHDDQGYITILRALITVGRGHLAGIHQVTPVEIDFHVLTLLPA
jgi:hypothetical protein